MCGRFTLTTADYDAVADAFAAEPTPEVIAAYRPRYNVAPSDRHVIVLAERELVMARWGIARKGGGGEQINARAEVVHTRPTFRAAFRQGRVLVPADGFFEWHGEAGHRLPIWFHGSRGLLGLAGVALEHVDDATGEVTRRFAILTTRANEVVAPAHDRMPVIIAPHAYATWLRPLRADEPVMPDDLRALLTPAPSDVLVATEVSDHVNRVDHDDPACIVPWAHPHQGSLF
jgi:putative SOS response-associated peptidase YedK